MSKPNERPKSDDYDYLRNVYLKSRKRNKILFTICIIMVFVIVSIFFFNMQWNALAVFGIGSLTVLILWNGTIKSIVRSKNVEDLEEAYKSEKDEYERYSP